VLISRTEAAPVKGCWLYHPSAMSTEVIITGEDVSRNVVSLFDLRLAAFSSSDCQLVACILESALYGKRTCRLLSCHLFKCTLFTISLYSGLYVALFLFALYNIVMRTGLQSRLTLIVTLALFVLASAVSLPIACMS
jgi:hypothetical protein